MKALVPGHVYLLDQLDTFGDISRQSLAFVKRIGEGYPGNAEPAHCGVTVQEVCRMLIDRLQYVSGQAEHMGDEMSVNVDRECIEFLRSVIRLLEFRAAVRHGRPNPFLGPEYKAPELEPICRGCGHVGCAGGCGRG